MGEPAAREASTNTSSPHFSTTTASFNLPHFSSKGFCSLPQGQIVYLDLDINILMLHTLCKLGHYLIARFDLFLIFLLDFKS